MLVHGGWTGAWAWDFVVDELTAREITTITVDLLRGSLAADTAAVQGVVDEVHPPPVVCGWSYGGCVVTGLHPDTVHHLVYLAAFVPDIDETPLSLVASAPTTLAGSAVVATPDGLIVDPELARAALCHDCADTVAHWALRRLVPESGYGFTECPPTAAWKHVPSTAIVCTDDRFLSPEVQRAMSRRATFVEELPASHAALWSRPADVATLLEKRCRANR